MKSFAVLFVALTLLAGCAATQRTETKVASTTDLGAGYAGALSDAFDAYEAEVQTAIALTYTSQAEADAVIRTLSPVRLDHKLKQALAARKLTLSGFVAYAQEHADFFHAQQRRHWGRLDQIERTINSIALRVQPTDEQMALLSHAAE